MRLALSSLPISWTLRHAASIPDFSAWFPKSPAQSKTSADKTGSVRIRVFKLLIGCRISSLSKSVVQKYDGWPVDGGAVNACRSLTTATRSLGRRDIGCWPIDVIEVFAI